MKATLKLIIFPPFETQNTLQENHNSVNGDICPLLRLYLWCKNVINKNAFCSNNVICIYLTPLQNFLQQPVIWANCWWNNITDGNQHDFRNGVIMQLSMLTILELGNSAGNMKDRKM